MKKILITGAGGYIGSVASYLFLQKGFEVIGVDNFSRGFQQPLNLLQSKFGSDKFRWYKADLRDSIHEVFEKEESIQAVVHYGALCSVPESMQQPDLYFSNDAWGCANLLKVMTDHQVRQIVFSSTCAVYGESHYVPIDEKHPKNPISPYGEAKRMAEQMMEWYARLKGLRYVMLRYFNVCGASDDSLIGDSKKPSFHLMQNAVRGALGIEKFQLVCPKVDTPDGTPIRDYVNVVDLNEAHILALEYLLQEGKSDVFNLGTGNGNSVLEIIQKVEQVTGQKIDITPGETREGDPARLYANNQKAKQVLGWNPSRSLEHSVKSLVEWYKVHPHGWDN